LVYTYCKKNFETTTALSKRTEFILGELKEKYNYVNSKKFDASEYESGDMSPAHVIIVDKTDINTMT